MKQSFTKVMHLLRCYKQKTKFKDFFFSDHKLLLIDYTCCQCCQETQYRQTERNNQNVWKVVGQEQEESQIRQDKEK